MSLVRPAAPTQKSTGKIKNIAVVPVRNNSSRHSETRAQLEERLREKRCERAVHEMVGLEIRQTRQEIDSRRLRIKARKALIDKLEKKTHDMLLNDRNEKEGIAQRQWNKLKARYLVKERMYLLMVCAVSAIVSIVLVSHVATALDYSSADSRGATCVSHTGGTITEESLAASQMTKTSQRVALAIDKVFVRLTLTPTVLLTYWSLHPTVVTGNFMIGYCICCLIIGVPLVFTVYMSNERQPFQNFEDFYAENTTFKSLFTLDVVYMMFSNFIIPAYIFRNARYGDERRSILARWFAAYLVICVPVIELLPLFSEDGSNISSTVQNINQLLWIVVWVADFGRQDLLCEKHYIFIIVMMTFSLPSILNSVLVWCFKDAESASGVFVATMLWRVTSFVVMCSWEYHMRKGTRTDNEALEFTFPCIFAVEVFNDMIFLQTEVFSPVYFAVLGCAFGWKLMHYSGWIDSLLSSLIEKIQTARGHHTTPPPDQMVRDYLYIVLTAELCTAASILSPLSLLFAMTTEVFVLNMLDTGYNTFTSRMGDDSDASLAIAGYAFVLFGGLTTFAALEVMLHRRQLEVLAVAETQSAMNLASGNLHIDAAVRQTVQATMKGLREIYPHLHNLPSNEVYNASLIIITMQRKWKEIYPSKMSKRVKSEKKSNASDVDKPLRKSLAEGVELGVDLVEIRNVENSEGSSQSQEENTTTGCLAELKGDKYVSLARLQMDANQFDTFVHGHSGLKNTGSACWRKHDLYYNVSSCFIVFSAVFFSAGVRNDLCLQFTE